MAAALNVGYPTGAVSEARRSCNVETAVRQKTEVERYPLWDPQPMKMAEERSDVF